MKKMTEIPYPKHIGDKGNYFIIEESIEKDNLGQFITVISKRVGVDYTDYTKVKISCANKTYLELAYSEESIDSLVECDNSKWTEIIEGSSKYHLVNFICNNYT